MITPEFLDKFGILAFAYITVFSLISLFRKKSVPKWMLIILLVIGISGLIADLMVVLFYRRLG